MLAFNNDPALKLFLLKDLAMLALWGAPTGIYAPRYRGVGLTLLGA